MAVIDNLAAEYEAQGQQWDAEDTAKFTALVIELDEADASFKHPMPIEEFNARLSKSKRTIEQLRAAVLNRKERRRLFGIVEEGEGLSTAPPLQELLALRKAAEDAQKLAERNFRNKGAEIAALEARMRDAAEARRQLLRTSNPATQRRYQDMTTRIEALASGFQDLMAKQGDAETRYNAAVKERDRSQSTLGAEPNPQAEAAVTCYKNELNKASGILDARRIESETLQTERAALLLNEALDVNNF